jgi:uncharacterized protein YndB with AHSA1/START domain
VTDDEQLERELGHRRIAAGEARTAIIRRRYDAPIEDVWQACTDPRRVSRWFLDVTGDLREGGSFSLSANASGQILRCEPPRLLVLSWAYGERPVDEVTLRLVPGEGGDTLLELEHATIGETVEWDGRPVDVITGVGEGWELPLVRYLARYLRGELPDEPSSEWYTPTAEDAAFAARSVEAWDAILRGGG